MLTQTHTPVVMALAQPYVLTYACVCPMIMTYTQAASEWNGKEVCQRSAVSYVSSMGVKMRPTAYRSWQWRLRQVAKDRHSTRPSSSSLFATTAKSRTMNAIRKASGKTNSDYTHKVHCSESAKYTQFISESDINHDSDMNCVYFCRFTAVNFVYNRCLENCKRSDISVGPKSN